MRVLLAPDSFKGTLDAQQVALAMRSGVCGALEHVAVDCCPIADGGEGTISSLRFSIGEVAQVESHAVPGLDGSLRVAHVLRMQVDGARLAIVELAQIAGLTLLPPVLRDPTRTTTYGVGALLRRVFEDDRPVDCVLIGVGGSATCDGGAGAMQALGVEFLDRMGRSLKGYRTGGNLEEVASMSFDRVSLRRDVCVEVACDVRNPLLGQRGASRVYAPQKGASAQQVEALERALGHFASLLPGTDARAPGMGASGGFPFGMCALEGYAFESVTLVSGVDRVLELIGFDERLARADLVITGEGTFDAQSGEGKAVDGVLTRASGAGVPVALIAGQLADDVGLSGFSSTVGLVARFGAHRAMGEPEACIEQAAADIVRSINASG